MRGDKNEKKVQLWNNNVNIITLFRVIFYGFSKMCIRDRIKDSDSKCENEPVISVIKIIPVIGALTIAVK